MNENIILDEAKDYATRVCSGQFPVEYTREQVINYGEGDFLKGADYFKRVILHLMKSNIPDDVLSIIESLKTIKTDGGN